jgi:hypothetical protein
MKPTNIAFTDPLPKRTWWIGRPLALVPATSTVNRGSWLRSSVRVIRSATEQNLSKSGRASSASSIRITAGFLFVLRGTLRRLDARLAAPDAGFGRRKKRIGGATKDRADRGDDGGGAAGEGFGQAAAGGVRFHWSIE